MSYQYDLADFKRYLNDKNAKYRIDGLIFWQNRIPLPVDLFNRIFNESDQIVADYVYQVTASAVTFSNRDSFESTLAVDITDLPNGDLSKKITTLQNWLVEYLPDNSQIINMAYEIADILGLDDFRFSLDKVVDALQHQGKKYARIFIPSEVREEFNRIRDCENIGRDNTDMFGNIIADRYNIYRSGFSDALSIIFNALLDFRILCSSRGNHLNKFRVIVPIVEDIDVRLGKTTDGSLWEPGYEDDHYIILNSEHPMMRQISEEQAKPLAELLFFLGEFENGQFSDENKKMIENLRQTVSRSLWIKND
ncbi:MULTISPECIES: hypothetical protein [Yersinia]|uniref:hypothetical protein n=1 Tax=Yersinia TaxID=629 RepID=UPI0005E57226|nr:MULTISPECIES: hypothetical protein [Yersinia]EKN5070578.1 hypothetical protein [Yersinia enterocolitica]ELI7916793.1 hypothetical protein [Yersinia enterocolitica]ELI8323559.1 hypothetical protein [Yersinia enterocolitica]OWF74338.1 hypothetical protein B4902_06040 [Yersinia frederiksenii]CNH00199.1 Uncharacterised protein [Yersinia kristensenii]